MLGATFPKPNLVLRSSSTSDVFVNPDVPPSHKPRPQSKLNSHPQDFVVTSGNAYRVIRSPRGIVKEDVARQSPVNMSMYSGNNSSNEQSKVRMLLRALDEANRKIMEQNEEIIQYKMHIVGLERELGREPSFVLPDVMLDTTPSSSSPLTLIEDIPKSQVDSTSYPPSHPTPRSRRRLQTALHSDKIRTDHGQGLVVDTGSPTLTPTAPLHTWSGMSLSVPAPADSVGPTNPPADTSACPSGSPHHISGTGLTAPSPVSLTKAMSLRRYKDKQSVVDRVSMSTPQGGALRPQTDDQKDTHTQPYRETQTDTQAVAMKRAHLLTVDSDASTGGESGDAPQLYIAHDNPQLAKSIHSLMNPSPPPSYHSHSEEGGTQGQVLVMVESKDCNGLTCFILGEVIYSGSSDSMGCAKRTGGEDSSSRGSQCLICTKLHAYRLSLDTARTRLRGDITEICLGTPPAHTEGLTQGQGEGVDISSKDRLAVFLEPCTCRVDVILAPLRVDTCWFPYWEGEAIPGNSAVPPPGSRKLAPQFRSNGVGYLRLGDDMSRFGTSFLSVDGFKTFLDNADCTNIEGDHRRVRGGPDNYPADCSSRGPSVSDRGGKGGSEQGTDTSRVMIMSLLDELGTPPPAPQLVGMETTQDTSEKGLRWTDRVGLLHKVYACLDNGPAPLPSDIFISTAEVLLNHVLRQKNPLVLKESSGCAGRLGCHWEGYSARERHEVLDAWRELVGGLVHLLRHANRGVTDAARMALTALVPISRSDGCLLVGVLVGLAGVVEGMLMGGSKSGSVGGTGKVVQWLSGVISDYTSARHGHGVVVSTDLAEEEATAVVGMASSVLVLLGHREEGVRDGAVGLLAKLFALDVYVGGRGPQQSLPFSGNQPDGCTTTITTTSTDADSDARARGMSEDVCSSSDALSADTSGTSRDTPALFPEMRALTSQLSPPLGKSLLDFLHGASTSISPHVSAKLLTCSGECISALTATTRNTKISPAPRAPAEPSAASVPGTLTTFKRRSGSVRGQARRKVETKVSPLPAPATHTESETDTAIPTAADTSTPHTSTHTDTDMAPLSRMLFEAQLVLREPELSSQSAWEAFSQVRDSLRWSVYTHDYGMIGYIAITSIAIVIMTLYNILECLHA